jgi:hypothetical protein
MQRQRDLTLQSHFGHFEVVVSFLRRTYPGLLLADHGKAASLFPSYFPTFKIKTRSIRPNESQTDAMTVDTVHFEVVIGFC